jgi:hypothetical protein
MAIFRELALFKATKIYLSLPEYLDELTDLSCRELATGRARQPGSV